MSQSHAQSEGSVPDTDAPGRAVVRTLQIALHVLVAALLGLVAVRIAVDLSGGLRWWCTALAAAFGLTYLVGTVVERRRKVTAGQRAVWLGVISVLWALLTIHLPEAAYLVFPLFFVALWVWGSRRGLIAVALMLLVAVTALGLHRGWSAAGVIGPVVGAAVALAIGWAVRALVQESDARQRAIAELVATRDELAVRERELGRDAERARLAGEIHDTVAQGLSSIAMLLRSVERSNPDHPAADRIALARTTAVDSLTDTRRFVAALAPAALEGTTLAGALEKVASTVARTHPTVVVRCTAHDDVHAPAPVASALVRIAQEATANAVGHGQPTAVDIECRRAGDAVVLSINDDGRGFDPTSQLRQGAFGLDGMMRRATELGGSVTVDSAPGAGTRVVAEFPVSSERTQV